MYRFVFVGIYALVKICVFFFLSNMMLFVLLFLFHCFTCSVVELVCQ